MSDNYGKMSDAAMSKVTVRINAPLDKRLKQQSRRAGRTPSEIIRKALDAYLDQDSDGAESFYEVARRRGAIGLATGLPKDLSTNPKYMEGFGE